MRALTMKMRQFGMTTKLAELAMLQFYQELKKSRGNSRTLKDVMRYNKAEREFLRITNN